MILSSDLTPYFEYLDYVEYYVPGWAKDAQLHPKAMAAPGSHLSVSGSPGLGHGIWSLDGSRTQALAQPLAAFSGLFSRTDCRWTGG